MLFLTQFCGKILSSLVVLYLNSTKVTVCIFKIVVVNIENLTGCAKTICSLFFLNNFIKMLSKTNDFPIIEKRMKIMRNYRSFPSNQKNIYIRIPINIY